jgi:hypothetical protein
MSNNDDLYTVLADIRDQLSEISETLKTIASQLRTMR